MKALISLQVLYIVVCVLVPGSIARESGAQAPDILGAILDTARGGSGLNNDTIIKGLTEALTVGTGNAVSTVSLKDGYLGNESIRIPLPENIRNIESIVRMTGYGDDLDAFVVSMNRAAESAAPQAKALFINAIRNMTFSDARRILEGRENEATLYFRDKTEDKLMDVFQPLVRSSLNEVGVTKQYQELESVVRTLPVKNAGDFSLEQYVTQKALDGLFTMIAREEKKIRENPEARVSDILKTVFGR